ncbi:MAG TPA: N-acetylglucosamine-6-phosphate deacetylase [Streptosporangiaceae bacterium]|nr:N-acetylglucosamine-6-phosphate deacetylase [Streptosporangiaceae bacterium]
MLIAASSIIPATATAKGAKAILAPGYVIVTGGRITEVGSWPPPGRPDIELSTGFLVPGLVDLQVNGYFGVELGDADPAGWAEVVRRLPETGATAFLPTFITSPIDQIVAALRATAGFAPAMTEPGRGPAGARVLGVHLEGPFIAPSRRGAHNLDWIIKPDPKAIGALLTAGAGLIRVVTLAPEVDGAMAAIEQLTAAGVIVSVGHSDATAGQVAAAATAGARLVTHLFNAQRPMHHREPGVVGQALTDGRLASGLIADLHHVAGPVAGLAFRAAPERIFLVTDAAASAGMSRGRYVLGGEPINVSGADGTPPVRADGTLAGSALRMDAAIANMVAVGIGLPDAVAAATRIPADLIGRPDLGRIEVTAAADLTWLNDDLRTAATWVAGDRLYGPVLG